MSDLDPRLEKAFAHMLEMQATYTEALRAVEEHQELTVARIRWEEADDAYHQLQYEVRKTHQVDAKLDAMVKAELEFYEQRDALTPMDAETVIRGYEAPLRDTEYELVPQLATENEEELISSYPEIQGSWNDEPTKEELNAKPASEIITKAVFESIDNEMEEKDAPV